MTSSLTKGDPLKDVTNHILTKNPSKTPV